MCRHFAPALVLSLLDPKLSWDETEVQASIQQGVEVVKADGSPLSPYDLKRLQVCCPARLYAVLTVLVRGNRVGLLDWESMSQGGIISSPENGFATAPSWTHATPNPWRRLCRHTPTTWWTTT